MKTVGKQLQEARLAKNWTPELAARETKIKVDRLRDLEGDDYSHFTSPTYARGFVRTYARALGLDEYRILRQLDNKLPDDDSANIVTDSGVSYLPETAMPPRAAHRDFTGLYIVMGLGGVVTMAIVFVLFEAYRAGELSRWFASNAEPVAVSVTNAAPVAPTGEAPARALPVDSNTPPPIADATTNTAPATHAEVVPIAPSAVAVATPVTPSATGDTNTASDAGTSGLVSPRALPVDPSLLGAANTASNSAPSPVAQTQAPRALPVDPSELTHAAPVTPVPSPATASGPPNDPAQDAPPNAPMVAPRALPVDPSELTNAAPATPAPATLVAVNTPAADATNMTDGSSASAAATPAASPTPVPVPAPPAPGPASAARQSNSGPVMEPSLPAVEPSAESSPVAPAVSEAATNAAPPAATPADVSADSDKRLVLTASQDSFVRVTNLDSPDAEKPLYAAVLHSGQSVGFDGHKFSINVGIPSAVDIKLDGVNYGPHSDQEAPETFTVESHLP
jgi:cytoskeletal protein RodZ